MKDNFEVTAIKNSFKDIIKAGETTSPVLAVAGTNNGVRVRHVISSNGEYVYKIMSSHEERVKLALEIAHNASMDNVSVANLYLGMLANMKKAEITDEEESDISEGKVSTIELLKSKEVEIYRAVVIFEGFTEDKAPVFHIWPFKEEDGKIKWFRKISKGKDVMDYNALEDLMTNLREAIAKDLSLKSFVSYLEGSL